MGVLLGLAAIATTTRSKIPAASRPRAWCPLVMGSNGPGYTALRLIAFPLVQSAPPDDEPDDNRPRPRARCDAGSMRPEAPADLPVRGARCRRRPRAPASPAIPALRRWR